MRIKPIGKRVVLKVLEKEEKLVSGILLPDSSVEKPDYAEVLEISKDIEDENILKIGDKVVYTKYKGTTIKDSEDEFIVIDLEDILGIVEN